MSELRVAKYVEKHKCQKCRRKFESRNPLERFCSRECRWMGVKQFPVAIRTTSQKDRMNYTLQSMPASLLHNLAYEHMRRIEKLSQREVRS